MYRSIIEKFFPKAIKSRREAQGTTSDYHEILKQFEEDGKKINGQTNSLTEEQVFKLLFRGAAVVIAVAVLIVLLIVSI